ncbi:hypothetical protein CVT24_011026 [Panaeolus cyanescens]|uniref:PA14 domain-containing protein n=1 Tax=Panaeolus cyanescens TaxID=181874 RepID=A0A409VFX8_9AGAR|nr:hypothetical protein CVT24_011026 [Panaeolus cyanescens]
MFYKGLLLGLVAACATQVLGIDFSASNYIWTNEGNPGPGGNMPVGTRAFRRAAYAPRGKRTRSADILISADNAYELYVNEVKIGTGSNFHTAQLYHVPLTKGCNVFAVNATNTATVPNPAGLVATIKVRYTDGSTETIVTDQTWRAFTRVPENFEDEDFFDGNWPFATVENSFAARPAYWANVVLPADAPLNNQAGLNQYSQQANMFYKGILSPSIQLPCNPDFIYGGLLIGLIATCATQVLGIDFSASNYIWTNEGNPGPGGDMPVGTRAFRRTTYGPPGKRIFSADILITADNGYELYVNEVKIGTGNDFHSAQLYHVPLTKSCNVFAVKASNAGVVPNPAGLIATIKIRYRDGSNETIVTDQSWRAFTSVPQGFEAEEFVDGSWPFATIESSFAGRPAYWGNVALPADAPSS